VWDGCLFLGSVLPAVLLGTAFANIFRGIPVDQNGVNHGTLLTLLNPYGILGGALFLLLFLVHGAIWLAVKTEGDLHRRSVKAASRLWPILLGVAVVFLAATKVATRLYDNYLAAPALFLVPLITVGGLLGVRGVSGQGSPWGKAWISSAVTIFGAVFFGVIGLYPVCFRRA